MCTSCKKIVPRAKEVNNRKEYLEYNLQIKLLNGGITL